MTKRERGLRHALAAALALPPAAMLVLQPPRFETATLTWSPEWQFAFIVFMGLSLAVGWRPAKEAWTGDDHDVYVDDPEVGDE